MALLSQPPALAMDCEVIGCRNSPLASGTAACVAFWQIWTAASMPAFLLSSRQAL
jgi:hypothetical protein